jgi:NADPH:quinone reductase-like Zn-dependent oxidoreductase
LYPDRGAFAEYLKTNSNLAWKVPETMKYTDATTYDVLAVTAALVLCGRLGFPHVATLVETGQKEATDGQTIFFYAGSTSADFSIV